MQHIPPSMRWVKLMENMTCSKTKWAQGSATRHASTLGPAVSSNNLIYKAEIATPKEMTLSCTFIFISYAQAKASCGNFWNGGLAPYERIFKGLFGVSQLFKYPPSSHPIVFAIKWFRVWCYWKEMHSWLLLLFYNTPLRM